MTHAFHPLSGREFAFVAVRRTWKQDRVFFFGEDGTLDSLPTAWTDAAEPDAFVVVAAGRSPFRAGDLVALAELIDGLATRSDSNRVQGEFRRMCKGDCAAACPLRAQRTNGPR